MTIQNLAHKPCFLHLSNRLPSSGNTLRYESDIAAHSLTVQISIGLRASQSFKQLHSMVGGACAKLFVEKQLFESLLPIMRALYRRLYLRECNDNQWRIPIIIADPTLKHLLDKMWPYPDIVIRSITLSLGYRARGMARRIKDLFNALRPIKASTHKNRIGIELIEGVAHSDRRNEMLWWDERQFPLHQLLGYNVFSMPFDGQRQRIAEFKKKGCEFSAHLKSQAKSLDVNYQPMPSAGPWTVLKKSDAANAWLENHIPSWIHAVNWWETFFKKKKIKLWISVNEAGMSAIAQRAAMERVGGVTLFRQRSEYSGYPDSVALMPAHVALVWNDSTVEYLNLCRNRNVCSLVTGHTMGAAAKSVSEYSKTLNNRLRHNGARFIVAFFDSMFASKNAMTQDEVSHIYSMLCEWVLERPDFGAVFKPKKKWDLTIKWIDLELLKKAVATGRLIVVKDPTILPMVVSAAVDLTIGVGISSAVLEANIAGYRGIHINTGYAYSHCIERKGVGRLVFTSLNDAYAAIEKVYQGEGGSIGFSDDLIFEIDKYCDGSGPERMQEVIKTLLSIDLNDMQIMRQKLMGLENSWSPKHRG